MENSYIESFNGRLRDEVLNGEIFPDLAMLNASSNEGATTTIGNGRIARWRTERRANSQQWQRASANRLICLKS